MFCYRYIYVRLRENAIASVMRTTVCEYNVFDTTNKNVSLSVTNNGNDNILKPRDGSKEVLVKQ